VTRHRTRTDGRSAGHLVGLAVVLGGVLVIGLLGWRWHSDRTVARVSVSGTHHASPDTVRHLARVDSGSTLEAIDARRVTDRVIRHPWVETAAVTKRHLKRTLHIAVTERTPVALTIGSDGNPSYYLDKSGNAMPVADSGSYDVPLVRGLTAEYNPVRRVAPPRLRRVLGALGPTGTDTLIAEVVLQPDRSVRLLTVPIDPYGAVPVRLGTGQLETKLRHFRAFTEEVLHTQSERPVGEIDLRFDGQIVSRERPLNSTAHSP